MPQLRFRLLPMLLGIGLFACSSPVAHPSTDAGHVDAGHVVDSGPVDAGPMGPQPIGGACAHDGDCTSMHCDTLPPGGFCVATCTQNSDCSDGAVCEQIGQGKTSCVPFCTTSADCRAGYTCAADAHICAPTTGGCKMDSDCPASQVCDTTTGLCSGASSVINTIGGLCSADADCSVGRHPWCLTSDMNFSGGYCTSYCRSEATCGSGNFCVPGLVTDNPDIGLCLEGCKAKSDCRANYNCIAYNNENVCFPSCKTDMDCIGNGQTCDATSGLCSGGMTQPDAGMVDAGAIDDAGTVDAGAVVDAGTVDAGALDVDAGAVDAGSPLGYDGGYPAPRPAPPQVVSAGGSTMKAPKIVPVFFSNDDAATVTALEDFDQRIGATNYWSAVTQEYGVGPAVSTAPILLPEISTGTISDSSIQAWLENQITAKVFPAPDENTIYVLHYPASTTIILGGQQSCQSFGGYHSDAVLGDGTDVAYAVLPRCHDQMSSDLDLETGSESHELVEVVTDPYPMNKPAYTQVDDAHIYWSLVLGGSEVGDMCAQNNGVFVKFPELPYQVQRTWSNASAAAGHDPCVPEVANEVFFAAVPEQNDSLIVGVQRQSFAVTGVKVPAGTSRTISLDLFSEAVTGGPWTVTVQDIGAAMGGQSALTYSLNQTTGMNGDKLALTITASAQAASAGPSLFIVESKLGASSHSWIGIAGP